MDISLASHADLAEDMPAPLKTLACTHLRVRQLMRQVSQHYDVEMASVGMKTT